ncbi:MAG: CPBP family intramembrane metalloprotease [Acidobacteriota bacterium]|nr:CPBP family intramembrane metalloprotease [Acidobacteriota bacterium]
MTDLRKTWLILVGITAAEAVPLIVYTVRGGARFARYLGFGGANRGTTLGWLLALLCAAVFTANTVRRSPLIRDNFFRVDATKLFAVLLFAPVTGVFEEMYFRKALMDGVQARGGGALAQIALSAVVFGLGHGIWGLFGRSLRIAAGATVATALLGAALAVVYLAAGRSAAPCSVAHALINACIEPWLILAAASRSWNGLRTAAVDASA